MLDPQARQARGSRWGEVAPPRAGPMPPCRSTSLDVIGVAMQVPRPPSSGASLPSVTARVLCRSVAVCAQYRRLQRVYSGPLQSGNHLPHGPARGSPQESRALHNRLSPRACTPCHRLDHAHTSMTNGRVRYGQEKAHSTKQVQRRGGGWAPLVILGTPCRTPACQPKLHWPSRCPTSFHRARRGWRARQRSQAPSAQPPSRTGTSPPSRRRP